MAQLKVSLEGGFGVWNLVQSCIRGEQTIKLLHRTKPKPEPSTEAETLSWHGLSVLLSNLLYGIITKPVLLENSLSRAELASPAVQWEKGIECFASNNVIEKEKLT